MSVKELRPAFYIVKAKQSCSCPGDGAAADGLDHMLQDLPADWATPRPSTNAPLDMVPDSEDDSPGRTSSHHDRPGPAASHAAPVQNVSASSPHPGEQRMPASVDRPQPGPRIPQVDGAGDATSQSSTQRLPRPSGSRSRTGRGQPRRARSQQLGALSLQSSQRSPGPSSGMQPAGQLQDLEVGEVVSNAQCQATAGQGDAAGACGQAAGHGRGLRAPFRPPRQAADGPAGTDLPATQTGGSGSMKRKPSRHEALLRCSLSPSRMPVLQCCCRSSISPYLPSLCALHRHLRIIQHVKCTQPMLIHKQGHVLTCTWAVRVIMTTLLSIHAYMQASCWLSGCQQAGKASVCLTAKACRRGCTSIWQKVWRISICTAAAAGKQPVAPAGILFTANHLCSMALH